MFQYVKSNLSLPEFELEDSLGDGYRLYVDPEATFDGKGIVGENSERAYVMELEFKPKDAGSNIQHLTISFHYLDPSKKMYTIGNDNTIGLDNATQNSFLIKYENSVIKISQSYKSSVKNIKSEEYFVEQQRSAVSIVERLILLLKNYDNN